MENQKQPFVYMNINHKKDVFKKIKINNFNKIGSRNLSMLKSSNPFFHVLNEIGTLNYFIEALDKKSEFEARGYLSSSVSVNVNLDDVYELFSNKIQYKTLYKFKKEVYMGICTVSISLGKNDEIVHIKMIEEPDHNSVWKIFAIERE